ncbi:hypothetical protein HGA88_06945 [Candidatus Roizmanbacteria bacterium]|nr:hypothetical protein [Candidatus Roizmanbacteria bacterium]
MVTKITAHKGYCKKYPENTLLAFQKALELEIERIELDAQITKDRKIVVHHDYTLSRTENGQGVVFDQPFDSLLSLDAGSWFSHDFKGIQIPLLSEVFETCRSKVEYEIEIKNSIYLSHFISQLVSLVQEYNLIEKVEFTSFSIVSLLEIKRIQPKAKIGVFIRDYSHWMPKTVGEAITIEELQLGHVDVAHLPISLLNAPYIKALHTSGIQVHAANCDSADDLRTAFDLEVDQLSTTELEHAISLRKELQLPTRF